MGTKLMPLEIDPTDKSLDEVKGLLESHGFTVSSADITDFWDSHSSFASGKTVKGPPVHVIWIKNEEAPLLTVTLFNGVKRTLESGMDLHLFDRPTDRPKGQDWSAIRTINIMR